MDRKEKVLTIACVLKIVWTVTVTNDVFSQPDACVQLCAQDVAFIQEQDQIRLSQQRILHDRLP